MSRPVTRLFLCGLLTLLVCDATAFAQARRQSVLPTARELNRLGLKMSWWSQATVNGNSDKLVHLTADEEAVIAQSRTGIVTAFDAETGERLWSALLGTPDAPSYEVVTNDTHVLLVTGMNMFAIDKRTGKQLWKLTLPHHPSTAPGIDDAQAYIGTLDGSAYAFDLRIIRDLYEDQRLPEWSNVALRWRYATGAEITSQPVPGGRTINFASLDGSLYAVSQKDGSLTFQFETNGPIRTPIGHDAHSLYVASDGVQFFCIDRETGRMNWTFVSGLPIRTQPQVVDGSVFVTPEKGGLYNLSTETGFITWHQIRATKFLASAAGRIYASDELGNILVLAEQDGSIVSTLPLRAASVRVSNDRTDRMFVATETGVVMALKEAGSEFPRYHKFPERQPILPSMGPDPEAVDKPEIPVETDAAEADPAN